MSTRKYAFLDHQIINMNVIFITPRCLLLCSKAWCYTCWGPLSPFYRFTVPGFPLQSAIFCGFLQCAFDSFYGLVAFQLTVSNQFWEARGWNMSLCLKKKKKPATIAQRSMYKFWMAFRSKAQRLYCMDTGLLSEGWDSQKANSKKVSCFVLFINVFKYFWSKTAFQVWWFYLEFLKIIPSNIKIKNILES